MKDFIIKATITLIAILVIGFIIASFALPVYVWIKYGGMPIDEIPAWALGFFIGK